MAAAKKTRMTKTIAALKKTRTTNPAFRSATTASSPTATVAAWPPDAESAHTPARQDFPAY